MAIKFCFSEGKINENRVWILSAIMKKCCISLENIFHNSKTSKFPA